MAQIDAFFKLMNDQGASDLHLVSGQQPVLRIGGELERVKYKLLENDSLKAMLYEIAPEHKVKQFEETGDVDFAYEIPGLARYRANFFQQKYGVGAVFREIPSRISTCEELGLPRIVPRLATLPRGLVLVTGPTGSGKSTTLAAIIYEANKGRKEHILTIEDPIEFVHQSEKAVINHREVGIHTRSFAAALRGALREDPDIILVGEIRDLETAEIAVKAALTGHLVLSTLHTNDAPSTIGRLLDMGVEPFLVSSSLIMTVAQRLIRVICPDCKESIEVPPEALLDLGVPEEEVYDFTCYKGKGCSKCSDIGYRGRLSLFEVMPMADDIKELTLHRAAANEIKRAAIQAGMKNLRDSGIAKIKQGITTIEEVLRVTVD